jgi:ornithine cyclodeaminase/alanine dehydrogenase
MTAGRTVLYLNRADLDGLDLGVPEIIELLRSAFAEDAAGRAVVPHKSWIVRGPDTFFCALQCYLPSLGVAGCKWNSGNPVGAARGLPYIQGLYLLSDAETGSPLAIMDSAWITTARTAAAIALAVRLLARPGAETLAVLGCGVQGRHILDALRVTVPTLRSVRAYDISAAAVERYVADMSKRGGLDVQGASGPREAVTDADVIITAGPNTRPPDPLRYEWLSPGALGVSVNRDAFWAPEAVAAMDAVVTDDSQQIEELKGAGFFTTVRRVDAELGDVIAGLTPGRSSPASRVLVFKLGVALEDLATAAELYRRARERRVGTELPL